MKNCLIFCKLNFGTKFETFAKIDVNGKNASPLFVHLKKGIGTDYPNKKSILNCFFQKEGSNQMEFHKVLS